MRNFKLVSLAAAVSMVFGAAQAVEVTGAGASFPAPIYAKWADAYQKATGNKINYQSIGSGGGIKQITAKTVDFGASDKPLEPEELDKAGLVQFPTVIGGVVPVVNFVGIAPGQLKLTGAVLADIYLGKILKWNDKAIADLNPGLALPDQSIAVVRRADGSGTSFIFTSYLVKVSDDWKSKVGEANAAPNWPIGLGGKGNEGVSAFVTRIPGSIGYVEYVYAKQNKMNYAVVQNAAGAYVQPDDTAFKAAAAGADWSRSYYAILTNATGKGAWPISGATFILMQKLQDKPEQGVEVLKFFDWSYKNGTKMAEELDFVPLPEALVKQIHTSWGDIKDASGKVVWKK